MKNQEVKIEKGIPVVHKQSRKWMTVIQQWEVGDSVLVTTRSDAGALRMSAKRHGQRVSETELSGGKIRVWRTE